MAKQVIWTDQAANELKFTIEYWNQRNQSPAYVKRIRKVLRQTLKLISTFPEIGRPTNYPSVRAKPILRHFLIIYKLGDKEEIVILNFWDVRQDPELNLYIS